MLQRRARLGENDSTHHCYAHAAETQHKKPSKNASKPVSYNPKYHSNIEKHSIRPKTWKCDFKS